MSGANRSSWQSPSFGWSSCLFHEEPQSHDVCQCGHCEHTHTTTLSFSWTTIKQCLFCFAFLFYHKSGFVRQAGPSTSAVEQACSETHVTWLNQRKVKSFYRGVVATELRSGVNMLLQVRVTTFLTTGTNSYVSHVSTWGRRGEREREATRSVIAISGNFQTYYYTQFSCCWLHKGVWVALFLGSMQWLANKCQNISFFAHTPLGGRLGSYETQRSSDGFQDRLAQWLSSSSTQLHWNTSVSTSAYFTHLRTQQYSSHGRGWLRSGGFVSKFTSALCVSATHLTYSMELGCSGWGRDWIFLNHLNYMVNNFSMGLVENSNGMSFFIYGSSVVQMFSGESM